MVGMKKAAPDLVNVRVELFGSARRLARCRYVQIAAPGRAEVRDLTTALAQSCPELVGEIILASQLGLEESYVFNLNGRSFVSNQPIQLRSGDNLLLFSSQAGG